MTSRAPLLQVLFVALLAAACSGSVNFSFGGETAAEAAVDLIEGEAMAQQLMTGPITGAVCNEPASQAEGTTFLCTATAQEKVIEFSVLIEADDRIFAETTNVVVSAGMDSLETSVVQALNDANGFGLALDALECGDDAVVLDADRNMMCLLTDASDGVVYNTQITIGDTSRGDFNVEILDPVE